jgi:hypothetical protein
MRRFMVCAIVVVAIGVAAAPAMAGGVAAPSGVRVAASPTAAKPVLSWNPVSGATMYRVFRDGRLVGQTAGTRWIDGELRAAGRHEYRVRATAAGSVSASSVAVHAVYDPVAPASIDQAPTALVNGDGAVELRWAAASDRGGAGLARYNVRRDGVFVGSADPATLRFVDTDASAGPHTYEVRAEDGAGNKAASFSPAVTVIVPAAGGGGSEPTPSTPPLDSFSGVSARLGNDYSVGMKNKYPRLKLVSVELHWDTLEPRERVFEWGRLEESLADARDRDYKLILRVLCGFRAPAWLYADQDHPVTPVDMIPTDDGWPLQTGVRVPLPWDPNLVVHYRGMMHALQDKLSETDGAGGTWADHVLFVPVAMPSVMGSEMPIGYGSGMWTGTFGGVTKTWNRRDTNRAVWLRHAPSGATEADRTKAIQTAMKQAWSAAIDTQLTTLTSVPSAVAFGFLFADGYAGAQWIAETKVAQYPGRLWTMTTNLQPKVRPDGSLGPWSEWCPACDRALRTAIANGGIVGFQTERGRVNNTATRIRYAVNDALTRYPLRFLETVGPIIALDQPFFLETVQNRLAQLARE